MKHKRIAFLSFALSMLLLCQAACANAVTSSDAIQWKEMDLKEYFGDVDGCSVIYSPKEQQYYAYHPEMANIQEIPCSTFKIVSALAGLENGIIQDEHTVFRWDGTQQMLPQWNQDLSLASAFQLSANWYFDTVDEKAGKENLKDIVQKIQYGNLDLSGEGPSGESTIKISPLEQVHLMEKLFTKELPLSEKNMEILKKIMYIDTEKGKLYGKTGTSGTSFLKDGAQTAWFVGAYQTSADTFYFATRIYGDKDRTDIVGGTAQQITQKICEEVLYQ